MMSRSRMRLPTQRCVSFRTMSFRAWANLKERNQVTSDRKTRSPLISQELSGMRE